MAIRLGETPVPIPNTMVKPQAADGTALETVWESRWPPDHKILAKGSARVPGVRFLGRSLNVREANFIIRPDNQSGKNGQ